MVLSRSRPGDGQHASNVPSWGPECTDATPPLLSSTSLGLLLLHPDPEKRARCAVPGRDNSLAPVSENPRPWGGGALKVAR